MKRYLYYNYLGENGTLLSPILIPNTYHIKKYMLSADPGKLLTKDGSHKVSVVIIPESELNLWYEVEDIGQD